MNNFDFSPLTGLNDTNVFPRKPGAAQARQQFMTLFYQIRDYLNSINNTWNSTAATLTYSSADAPTFVVSTSSDLSGIISVGMKIKLTQATAKYFFVTAITSSSIALYGGTDYTLTSDVISGVYYSDQKAPFGFPLDPNKWSVIISDATNQASNSAYPTYSQAGSLQITIPIGTWAVSLKCDVSATALTSQRSDIGAYIALSANSSSVSDFDLSTYCYTYYGSVAPHQFIQPIYLKSDSIALTTKTIYKVIAAQASNGYDSGISINGASTTTKIRAVCAYL